MEDRTESILRHADKWELYLKKRGKSDPTLNSKIEYIKTQAKSNRKDLLFRYFSDDLLDNLQKWKDTRNKLIHALLKQELKNNEIADSAEEGKTLAFLLRDRAGAYKKAVQRRKALDK